MHRFFERAAAALDRLLKWYLIVLMALLVVLTFVQVVARYLMHSPFTSTPQYARLVLVWLTFMGAALAVRQNKLVRIEVLENRLPAPVRTFLEVFFDVVLLGLLLVIIVKGRVAVIVSDSQIVAGTPLSYSAFTVSIVLGSVLMFFYIGLRLWSRFRGENSIEG